MDNEIIKTDLSYRRKLFIAYLVAIGIGLALWRWGIPALTDYLDRLPNKERVETLELISHIFLFLFFPPAIYLIIIGRRICRYGVVPYPGMKVIRDTIVIKGKKALFRGRILVVLGITLMILALTSMAVTHLIIRKFKHHPLISPLFCSDVRGILTDGDTAVT